MFNDLNNQNKGHQGVDDIFADTDKVQVNTSAPQASPAPLSGGSEIKTQKIGLAADEFSQNNADKKGKDKIFKIVLAAIAVVILGLGGYLVYSKFLMAPAAVETAAPVVKKNDVTQTPAASSGSFVDVSGSSATSTATSTEIASSTLLASGVNASSTMAAATSTSALTIDTDGDGLTDYDEVNIYKTDPLNADTDGDGYLDGAEVKSGYNPKGSGKLIVATSTSALPAVK